MSQGPKVFPPVSSERPFSMIISETDDLSKVCWDPQMTKLVIRCSGVINQKLTLPDTITELELNICRGFDKITLPKSLLKLSFGDLFYNPINDLPDSVTHLTIGN